MTTLKVRVNPENPKEFATYSDSSDTYSPWWVMGRDWDRWVKPSEVAAWREYELAIPVPPPAFKAGDVAKVRTGTHQGRIRVRDSDGYWKSVNTGASTKLDHHIREGLDTTYELLGNVKDLVPAF